MCVFWIFNNFILCVYVATCPSTRSQKKTCLPRVPVSLVHSFIFALLLNNFCVTKYTYRRKKIFDVNGEFYTIRFSFLLLNCTDFLFIELYRPVGFFSYCLLTFESHQLCNSHFGGLFGIIPVDQDVIVCILQHGSFF